MKIVLNIIRTIIIIFILGYETSAKNKKLKQILENWWSGKKNISAYCLW